MSQSRILVVEDDALLMKMYQRILDRHGWNAKTVFDGSDAIAALAQGEIAIVILDLHMPGTDGYAVLEHIKKTNLNVSVIVMTNMSDDTDKKKCLSYGVSDFFVKSDMDLDTLAEMIQKYI